MIYFLEKELVMVVKDTSRICQWIGVSKESPILKGIFFGDE
jgi:hypothetical protein